MKEIWKDVNNYENNYEVSNNGRIRAKEILIENAVCKFIKKPRMKKQTLTTSLHNDNYSYYTVNLCKNGKCKTYRSHVIVATAFLYKESENLEVNHIDFNPLNNNIKNLEWVTHKENIRHSIKNGRCYKIDIKKVEKLYKKGMSVVEIAKKMDFTKEGIYYAIKTRYKGDVFK